MAHTMQASTGELSRTRSILPAVVDRLKAADVWSWTQLFQFGAVAFQFGLLILIIRAFGIESRAFLYLAVYAFFGFLVHHFLPLRFRLGFFAALSLGGIAVVLGWTNALWIIGGGLLLIALAHAPLAMAGRIALVVVAGSLLAVLRVKPDASPVPPVIWPILGSMFMFRMMNYLYEMKHRTAPFSPVRALAYFFMLPNMCFPMFPIVDYKTFCTSHFNEDAIRIYQKGLWWCLQGIIHLLLYRLLYQNVLIDPATIVDAGDAAQYLAANYLIYLRFTGLFHLIVGLLHLFGFNLPRAFHFWLLSSGFTDLWRRVNIYWKNFLQKLVFLPAYFWFNRRVGRTSTLVLATAYAFVITWALHSYQWFWIRGAFPILWNDVLFWIILGTGVLTNMFLEEKFGRERTLSKRRWPIASEISRALKTICMFIFMCVSWTFWMAESPQEWWGVIAALGNLTPSSAAWIFGCLAGLGIASCLWGRQGPDQTLVSPRAASRTGTWPIFWRSTAVTVALSGLLLVMAEYPLAFSFQPRVVEVLDNLRSADRLSARDAKTLERGYYEDLTDVSRFNGELASILADRPADWNVNAAVKQNEGGYPPFHFLPSVKVQYKGATLETNPWGMHDREYSRQKPPGTFRIAILGSSHTVGIGVHRDETYENLVEDRLNREYARGTDRNFEILNFAVSGYGPVCNLATLEQKVLAFQPDVVINIGMDDMTWVVNELVHAADKQLAVPFPTLAETVRSADVDADVPRLIAEQRLLPHAREMLVWTYQRFVATCHAHGIEPLATVLPRPENVSAGILAADAEQTEMMKAAGFQFLDMYHAYDGVENFPRLWIRKWDRHPNQEGHQMLAEALYGPLCRYLDGIDEDQRIGGVPSSRKAAATRTPKP